MKCKNIFSGILFLSLIIAANGCASSSRESRSEITTTKAISADTTFQSNSGNFPGGYAQADKSPVTEKTTKVKEERVSSESGGVISTTFHFIGQVIAFPFKLIAGVIRFIF